MMEDPAAELIMQGLLAAGVANAAYLACPVGSGWREIALMIELQEFDRSRLRLVHEARWRAEVLDPNIFEAREEARRQHLKREGCVIDPSRFKVPSYTQDQYDALCRRVLCDCVSVIILAPGWEFSRGARTEVRAGFELGLTIQDSEGRDLTPAQVRCTSDLAVRVIENLEIPNGVARQLVPSLTSVELIGA